MQMENGGQKRTAFSTYAKPPNIRKAFSQHSKIENSHRTQTNVQQPFSNVACRCELAAKLSFFETSQSCVSTKVPLSHRFKSSPAIPGNLAVPDAAGYMMTAGHFRRNHESSGDLNRGRRTESRVLFGYFLHDAKSDKPFPFREIRGSANLKSARRSCGFALTKLKPFPKGASRFCKPRISAQNHNFALTKLKPFSKKESRFCKPRFSSPQWRLRTNKIKSFAASPL